MTDISTGGLDPEDRHADRKDLPMTQLDEDEVTSHRTTPEAPEGQGVGIGGEPTRLPSESDESTESDEATAGNESAGADAES